MTRSSVRLGVCELALNPLLLGLGLRLGFRVARRRGLTHRNTDVEFAVGWQHCKQLGFHNGTRGRGVARNIVHGRMPLAPQAQKARLQHVQGVGVVLHSTGQLADVTQNRVGSVVAQMVGIAVVSEPPEGLS